MSERQDNAKWSLIVWGGPALLLVAYGIWCILDGWFRPGYASAEFSRWATPAAFAAAAWCLYRGRKEYLEVKSQPPAEQRDAHPASAPDRPADHTTDQKK